MRTHYKVVCECGHEGEIVLSENDTPYGSSSWETYSLINLNGNLTDVPLNASWELVFDRFSIACPICDRSLSPGNLKG